MAQAGFESVSARRRLKAAGFDAEQAEAVVETVSEGAYIFKLQERPLLS